MENSKIVPIDSIKPEQIASICDHTYLNRPEAFLKIAKEGESPVRLRHKDLLNFLEETIKNKDRLPYAVCVRPEDVSFVKDYLYMPENKHIVVASVVGFPDGSLYDTEFKLAETNLAIERGAEEIDMVIDYNMLKVRKFDIVQKDIKRVVERAHRSNVLIKLILETSELNEEEIVRACEIAKETDVDFVKTSTGYGAYGAQPTKVRLMRENFDKGIKISGKVKPDNVKKLLYAASGRDDGYIELDPRKIRIGESSLLNNL
jgi:deoxyribose-phosphate aldolase